MTEQPLVLSQHGSVAWARMNRESVLCALDGAQLNRLACWLEGQIASEATRVLCITGTGRAFSVGGDIKEMDTLDADGFAANTRLYQKIARLRYNSDKPVISAINGYCLGGGLELACMSDLRIAAASAQFGLPDASLGFSVSGGLSWFLPRQIGTGRAMELYLTGRVLDAQEAREIGLVSEVVADEELEARTQTLAEQIASHPRTGFTHMKMLLRDQCDDFESNLGREEEYDNACFADIEVRQRLAVFLDSRRRPKQA